ncbi:hypothetical protein ACIA8J_36875 [Streptomyces asoensis]|uniref:hypothetical protein n=1 Tax=Streptomyces asoensis TaxID=249586 RepID=UPI0037B564B4
MGYSVRWSGDDLYRLLRTDSSRVLDYPFAAFVVALATEVDREALDWLDTYRRAIDSVTGPEVAFLTFYNTAVRRMRRVDRGRLASRWTPHSFGIPTVDVPAGRSADDYLDGERWPGGEPPAEVFARTMTYESDNFARALGLRADELPCLVFFDEPDSGRYYLVFMQSPPEELLARLRMVISDYHVRARDSEYFRILSERRRLELAQADADDAICQSREILATLRDLPAAFDFSGDDPLGRLNRLQLRSAFRWPGQSDIPDDVRRTLDALSSKARAIQTWQRIVRSYEGLPEFRVALEAGEPTVEQARALRRTYSRLLRSLDPAAANPRTSQEWLTALDRVTDAAADPCILEVERLAADLRRVLTQGRQARIREIENNLPAMEAELERIRGDALALEERLQVTPRPSMTETFRTVRWAERRTLVARSASSAGTALSSHSDLLLKVLALFGIGN